MLAPLRIPPLEGAFNFRDLGGYHAADGRIVRWNRLYRSGSLHELTDGDLGRLIDMGMRCVFDLRSTSERRRFPSRVNAAGAIDLWHREHDQRAGDFFGTLRDPDAHPGHARDLMHTAYRKMPYGFHAAYRELFVRLAADHLPLVFHCTAGKDRTGIAAALVLSALGVPRESIVEDYMITEQFFERNCAMMQRGAADVLFGGIDRHLWEPLMRTEPSYLHAMFDELEETHGSMEGYLRDVLTLDAPLLGRVRANLLGDR